MQISEYKYLAIWANDEWTYRQEILVRIEQATATFIKMFTSSVASLEQMPVAMSIRCFSIR